MTSSALIEIGTEEFPLASLDLFYVQGAEKVREILSKNRLDFDSVRVEATPRRLVFFIQNLAGKQREERNTLLGPAHNKAYDSSGKPTPALEGFLKAHRASLREIQIQETPRGRYLALEKVRKGESTAKLLPRLLPEILSSFNFPKTMRWEKSGFCFPRPIRWVVVILGRKALSFSLAGIKTGRLSRGHRFLAAGPVSIPWADWRDYEKRLRSRHVIVSLAERRKLIEKTLKKNFHQKNFDPDLVHETALLVEEPFLIEGKFSGTYRDLPEEVLTTCMKRYQKVFACRDPKGNLMNRFAAVLNGRRARLSGIREGYEQVLESRLRDAQYFYDEDTKEPLEKKVGRLRELVFLERLGTTEARVERLRKLSREMASLSGHPDWEKNLDRVALFAKADLVSHMVGEFPELQGMMGREYMRERGEAPEVARAIGEQYLPKNLAEDYRALAKKLSPLGALFGIIDRVDLLVGAFGARLDPSGSEDPYALRRAGGCWVKLVRAFAFHFSLSELIRKSFSFYEGKLDLKAEELCPRLVDFLKERAAFELQVKAGTKPAEILQGVMKSSFEDLADLFERFEVLLQLSEKYPKVFFKTSKVVERTHNILKGAKEALDSVDPGLFQEPLEKELFALFQKKGPELQTLVKGKDYETATRLYGETFFDPLHEFFDGVLVNVADEKIRRNRQALMREINRLYTEGVADLGLLTQVKE